MEKKITRRRFAWYSIPAFIVVSIVMVTMMVHGIEEKEIRDSLYSNQIEIQQAITESIASNINTELQLIFLELSVLANSDELQENIIGNKQLQMARTSFDKINAITPTSALLLTDENAVVVSQISKQHQDISGTKLTGIPITEAQETLEPNISSWRGSGQLGYQLAMILPIIDDDDSLKGLLLLAVPAEEFFLRHENIYDIETRFLVALDQSFNFMITPDGEFVGSNFYDEYVQTSLGIDRDVAAHFDKVFSGQSSHAIFSSRGTEIINTGTPVSLNEKDVLYIAVVTPTESIASKVNDIIAADKVITSIMLATIAGVLILLFLKFAKNLEREKLAMIGQLSSNIAHDMRNPLGAIKSSTRRISKHNTEQNQVIIDETERINRAINRMSHQVEQVLNYVRTTPIVAKKSSLKEMIDYAIESVEIPQNITVESFEQDTEIECDPEKLEIVFVNLILNAVQAIDQNDGKIIIRATQKDDSVEIEFENTGPAIPADVLPKIFNPLFTTKLKGTGLGLSGCKNIIDQHNGTIEVSTEPVVFRIRIPRKSQDSTVQ